MAYLKTKKGTVLTPELIEKLAKEAEAGYDLTHARRERVGRPSLGPASGPSPRIAFRATPEIYKEARRRATREGRSVSELARVAVAAYLAKAPAGGSRKAGRVSAATTSPSRSAKVGRQ